MDASELINLPRGWVLARLEEVTTPVPSIDPTLLSDQVIMYFDIGSIDSELGVATTPKRIRGQDAPSRARRQVSAGDVLFSTVRPYLRAIAQVPSGTEFGIASTGFCVLRAETGVSSNYLFYYTRSDAFINELEPLQRGTNYPAVRDRDVLAQHIPLAPSDEQARIVEKIEGLLAGLDAGVADLKAAQLKLTQCRESLLKAAVTGELTTALRQEYMWGALQPSSNRHSTETGAGLLARLLIERRRRWEDTQQKKFESQGKALPSGWKDLYPKPEDPDIANLPKLPEGWVWASLDMVGEITSGVAKGGKRDTSVPVREVPYLRVANVQRGFLDLSEIKTILATESDIANLGLRKGDVLFTEGGDRDKLGRGWVWQGEIADCIHQNHVFRARPYLPELLSEFISHHGNTFGKIWFEAAGKQTINLASINMTMLRRFPVPIPPQKEQQVILDTLTKQLLSLDQQQKATEFGLKQSNVQRKNILKAAFVGQLVPQYQHEEAASTLLERIRTDRRSRAMEPKTNTIPIKKRGARSGKTSIDDVVDAIQRLPNDRFTFSELCRLVPDKYDTIREAIFTLLAAERPCIKQVFDAHEREMHFLRIQS